MITPQITICIWLSSQFTIWNYLYTAIRQMLLYGIICIRIKFLVQGRMGVGPECGRTGAGLKFSRAQCASTQSSLFLHFTDIKIFQTPNLCKKTYKKM